MEIVVFTQDGCVNCEMFKEALNSKGLDYKEHDAPIALNPSAVGYFEKHPDWKTSGAVPAMGLLQYENNLPIVVIDDEAHTYEEALSKIGAHSTSAVECTDGVCRLAS